MTTVEEVFAAARQMNPVDRLRLAALLLDDLVQKSEAVFLPSEVEGYSEEWSEEDISDFAAHSARYMENLYPDEEDYPAPEKRD